MLGKKVKDSVTGLTGIATARIEYMNGCVQYMIQPKVVKDGVPAKAEWYDAQQVKLVATKRVVKKGNTGGSPPRSVPHFGR